MPKTLIRPILLGAPFAVASRPAPGHIFPDFASMGIIPSIVGSDRGYHTEGDVVTRTVDGRDLNELWTEIQATLEAMNARRQTLIDFLTFTVDTVIEEVPQVGGGDFERASEFGEPKSIRPELGYFSMAYGFDWYDVAARYTWKFLAEATDRQVQAVHNSVLEADSRLIFNEVMRTVFDNVNKATDIRGQNYTVYKLYNADGTVPPPYGPNTFDGNHTHYLVSGNALVDSTDVEDLIEKLREHGYSAANGSRIVLLANRAQVNVIRTFRANVVNNNAAVALYDFVPAQGQPPLLVPNSGGLIGTQVAATLEGLTVVGQYGDALIIEEDYIPAGYMMIFGTGGEGALNNPIGIREHANPAMRGLRLLPGNRQNYPLVNSFYSRGFGTGVRQRGGAAILQVKASGTYDIPANFPSV